MRIGYARLQEGEEEYSSNKLSFADFIDVDAVFTDTGSEVSGLHRMMKELTIGAELIVCGLDDCLNEMDRRTLQKCALSKSVRVFAYDPARGEITPCECRTSSRGRPQKNLIDERFAMLYADLKENAITKKAMAAQLNVCYATLEKQIARYESALTGRHRA